jgi:phage terminase small subunit
LFNPGGGMALTSQQRAFVDAYIKGGMQNAAAAYRKAYPTSKKWDANSVAQNAHKLLHHTDIAPIIQAAREKTALALRRSVDRFAVSKERISDELARLAFSDARKLFSWGPEGVIVRDSETLDDDDALAVVEVSQTITESGGTIKVRLADKRAALIDLARLHGMVVDKSVLKIEDPLEAEKRALMRAELIRRLDALAVPEPLTIETKVARK